MERAIVTTSINGLTDDLKQFCEQSGWDVIFVSDKQTPEIDASEYSSLTVLDVEAQERINGVFDNLREVTPWQSFQRVNLGYVYAINKGYDVIYETDDDNAPLPVWNKWSELWSKGPESPASMSADLIFHTEWPNVYRRFVSQSKKDDGDIWPRGYPLDQIGDGNLGPSMNVHVSSLDVGVVQGLVNGDPDVDAIYRLTDGDLIDFDENNPLVLDSGVWSPFNAQNTLWREQVLPYLYLPQTVSMRHTDILRSYVAQRGMWAMDKKLVFTQPTVYQDRNDHDLMEDFRDEHRCYTEVKEVCDTLRQMQLSGDPMIDLPDMYEALEFRELVGEGETESVRAWVSDLR